jgi:phosphatidylglycerophosphate synthase
VSASVFAQIAESYRRSRKPRDSFFNRFVARPAASVLVVPLSRTPVTPNQITLGAFAVFIGAAALLLAWPGQAGLIAGVLVVEMSYVLDCADGQLARLRGTSTPVGAHLDFLTDELKAFLLVAATAVRLWLADRHVGWLIEGLAALCAVAFAISLTTFLRRPEYTAAAGRVVSRGAGDYGEGFAAEAAPEPAPSPLRRVVRAIEWVGHLCVHYPTYLLVIAVFDRLDVFLHVYLAVNAAYAARSLVGITRTLGRRA